MEMSLLTFFEFLRAVGKACAADSKKEQTLENVQYHALRQEVDREKALVHEIRELLQYERRHAREQYNDLLNSSTIEIQERDTIEADLNLRIHHLQQQIQRLKAENQEQSNELDQLKKQIEDLKQHPKAGPATGSPRRSTEFDNTRVDDLLADVQRLEALLRESDEEKTSLQDKLSSYEQRVEDLTKALAAANALEADLEDAKSRIAELEAQIERLQDVGKDPKVSQLEKLLRTAREERDDALGKLKNLGDELADAHRKLASLSDMEADLLSIQQENERLRSKVEAAEASLASLDALNEAKLRHLARIGVLEAELGKALNQLKEKEALEAKLRHAVDEMNRLRAQLRLTQAELEAKNSDGADAQQALLLAKLSDALEDVKAKEREIADLKALLDDAQMKAAAADKFERQCNETADRLRLMESDLERKLAEHRMVKAQLQETMDVLTRKEAQLQSLQDQLKKSNDREAALQAQILALQNDGQVQVEMISSLEQQLAQEQALRQGAEESTASLRKELFALQADLGKLANVATELEEARNQRDEMNNTLREALAQQRVQEQELQEVNIRLKDLELKHAAALERLKVMDKLEAELRAANDMIEHLKNMVQPNNGDNAELQAELERLQMREQALIEEVSKLKMLMKQPQDSDLVTENAELRQRVAELELLLSEERQKQSEGASDEIMDAVLSEIARLKEENERVKVEITSLRVVNEELRSRKVQSPPRHCCSDNASNNRAYQRVIVRGLNQNRESKPEPQKAIAAAPPPPPQPQQPPLQAGQASQMAFGETSQAQRRVIHHQGRKKKKGGQPARQSNFIVRVVDTPAALRLGIADNVYWLRLGPGVLELIDPSTRLAILSWDPRSVQMAPAPQPDGYGVVSIGIFRQHRPTDFFSFICSSLGATEFLATELQQYVSQKSRAPVIRSALY